MITNTAGFTGNPPYSFPSYILRRGSSDGDSRVLLRRIRFRLALAHVPVAQRGISSARSFAVPSLGALRVTGRSSPTVNLPSRSHEISQGPNGWSRPWLRVISCCTCTRGDRTCSRTRGCKWSRRSCSPWIYSDRFQFDSYIRRYPGRVSESSVVPRYPAAT